MPACSPTGRREDEACCGCWPTKTSTATSYVDCCCASRTSTLVRVQDVGLAGVDDPELLAWATENNRIVLTHDSATIPDYAYERLAAGERMPGIFILNDRLAVGPALQEIMLMAACSEQGEWNGRVVHLPL